ncbi:hypothetical protein [Planococcus sp. NCCP-2050]|uniref:hypothetical protein n=1 Tax=Planococcus sp. NCCP-2050 TaxID=2944679 RepID=UPI002041C363|nr:hypothetical protein [Planococcus sp. NCCP-2050]GKW46918.1 hypothetical protein NCCP2050_26100 [Planococcus sp. NCCP-2050]
MFKVLKLVAALSILMSLFVFSPSQASADPLLSALVKQQAQSYCGISARTISVENEKNLTEETSNKNISENENSIDSSELDAVAGTAFGTKYATSKSGSKIILPDGKGAASGHGYCHIFKRHMLLANNELGHEVNGIDQFQYAEYPDATLDIAMEVMNEQNYLGYSGNYRYKQGPSDLAGQTVRIILAKGNSSFSNFRYLNYDWVIVTMYPQ